MEKIRIGVLGPSDIAMRRMVPSLKNCKQIEYAGVAAAFENERTADPSGSDESCLGNVLPASMEKARKFEENFGGKIVCGYDNMLASDMFDAVYIALPPALHYTWAKRALEAGKHVLLEKPFTTCHADTKDLIDTARRKGLAVAENFAFRYHRQIGKITEIIDSGVIGDIRVIRSNFAFPFRGGGDFRYHKAAGGGALLDCGCYTLKMASILLNDELKIRDHVSVSAEGYDVDMYGAITAEGACGQIVQLSFGMDQQYNCDLEIWGSRGCIRSPRIYTAPPGMDVELLLTSGMEKSSIAVGADDQFANSAEEFGYMIKDDKKREDSYGDIIRQSLLMEQCMAG